MAPEEKRVETRITVIINQHPYHFDEEVVTGAELKEAAGIPAGNLLLREVPGPADDEPIADGQQVALKSGEHFYDMPPGNFGAVEP